MRPTSKSWAARAWLLQILAFAATFGAAGAAAITILLTRAAPNWSDTVADAYRYANWAAVPFAAMALWLAYRWLGLSTRELGLAAPVRGGEFLRAVGAGYLILWVALQVLGSFPAWLPTGQDTLLDASTWDAVTHSVRAGLVEEAVLLALPMAIMWRLRWPWWAQVAVLAALRLPFHLYYGPAAIAMVIVWCVLLRYAYDRVRLVWPFMVAHALYNLNTFVVPAGLPKAGITLVMLALGVTFFVRWVRRPSAVPPVRNGI
ncbi:CPBP family intramembrane metalloprotease [Nocardia uniformis]|uniref:CPBP family intramembrane metalloprotease n=1 Tax=Nocardia uniformis TaxID=53432 RepID=A0A849C9P3_9NOCA|nr:CPBP family intramembrane glutamic endopeptidase [Nocardia uniformis]NNH71579.1 CPBP family intramembrane metalloprotease [Nocardia uniformis]